MNQIYIIFFLISLFNPRDQSNQPPPAHHPNSVRRPSSVVAGHLQYSVGQPDSAATAYYHLPIEGNKFLFFSYHVKNCCDCGFGCWSQCCCWILNSLLCFQSRK